MIFLIIILISLDPKRQRKNCIKYIIKLIKVWCLMYANNELKIVVLICKVIRLLLIIRLYLDIINEYY